MAVSANKHFHLHLCLVLFLTQLGVCLLVVCPCDQEERRMVCSRRGLTSVPNCQHSNSAVTHMNLSDNLLWSIQPQDFTVFPDLNILDIQLNLLRAFPCGVFGLQGKLTELYLRNNWISSLVCEPESRHSGDLLNASGKAFPGHQMKAFHGLDHLITLQLGGNFLTVLYGRSFAGLSLLKFLHLENNQIKVLSRGAFQGLYSLIALDLSSNRLNAIKPSSLKGLLKMESLKLNGNQLQRIGSNTFQHCKAIKEINLSDNLIKVVEPLAFHHLSHLNVLWLNNNTISSIEPKMFDRDVRLSYLGLNANPCNSGCGLLSLKQWLESSRGGSGSESSEDGSRLAVRVFVQCSQPEPVPGHYLDVRDGRALTHSLLPANVCSHAELRALEPGAAHYTRNIRMTKTHITTGGSQSPQAQRRVLRRASPQLKGAAKHMVSGVTMLQYQERPADAIRARPTVTISLAEKPSDDALLIENLTDACAYNEQIALCLESLMVTSNSVFLKWTVTGRTYPGTYFRVMYDQFDTKFKFSRFVHVKQGMFCNLSDLRPQTPYFLCVESVLKERVCPVASRDLCVGVLTEAEAPQGPEPQTVILIFTGVNSMAIIAILILLACMYGLAWRTRAQADGVSLVFSARNRCGSCMVCAAQLSDLNSAVNTNSSPTGTYQPNDMDAIDLPPVH